MSLRCLITAGPTREHLDPVRYLSNGSSGKMGYALADAAVARGWRVDLVSGPVSLAAPAGVSLHRVVSADDMLSACQPLFAEADVVIAVAAVADFKPAQRAVQKIKKSGTAATLELVATVDVLKTLAAGRTAEQVIVGFAAETVNVEEYAAKKLREKNLDWIVANDVSNPSIGMDADANAVVIIGRNGLRIPFGPAPKADVARCILDAVAPDGA